MFASILLCLVIVTAIVFLTCFEVAILRDKTGRTLAFIYEAQDLRAAAIQTEADARPAAVPLAHRERMGNLRRPSRAPIAAVIAPPVRSKRRRA